MTTNQKAEQEARDIASMFVGSGLIKGVPALDRSIVEKTLAAILIPLYSAQEERDRLKASEQKVLSTAAYHENIGIELSKLRTENEALREVAKRLRVFAIHYRTHPKRNPNDELDATLAAYDATLREKGVEV